MLLQQRGDPAGSRSLACSDLGGGRAVRFAFCRETDPAGDSSTVVWGSRVCGCPTGFRWRGAFDLLPWAHQSDGRPTGTAPGHVCPSNLGGLSQTGATRGDGYQRRHGTPSAVISSASRTTRSRSSQGSHFSGSTATGHQVCLRGCHGSPFSSGRAQFGIQVGCPQGAGTQSVKAVWGGPPAEKTESLKTKVPGIEDHDSDLDGPLAVPDLHGLS